MSKQARKREFSTKERRRIEERDFGQCIFCMQQYHMEKANWFSTEVKGIMHYIPKAKNGLGIEQNGAIGCQYHHEMMDNGKDSRREEMLGILKAYLQSKYRDWDEESLVYNKWR